MTAMFFRFSLIGLATVLAASLPLFGQSSDSRPTPEPTPVRQRVNLNTTPAEQTAFDEAKAIDDEGNKSKAISKYRRFIKSNPASPLASKAQYRIAELFDSEGDVTKSFDAYQKLISQYPDTPDFEKAVTRQVLIANEFLGGRKTKFLGLEIVPGSDRAEEMFSAIIKNAPYSKNAPVAQFNLGITYERQGKTKEAAAAFQKVLDRYPHSSIADDALYQIGYIYMRLGDTGKSEDLTALITAKNTFEDFLLQYPKNEKAAQARDNLKKMTEKESNDLLTIARYYDRFKNYKAAAIYYNDVIRRAPGTPNAKLAQERIQTLRSEAGDDALRSGPEKAETGEKASLRRRLQTQVESSSLSNFNGPQKRDIVPDELPVVNKPKLRTDSGNALPMSTVEPALPNP
jgi:outer membrane protein assembly factor BamD